ncbi:MAG: ABC transporter ATP-binding protein [Ideonella sp.]|nr:ABC transporter ATP-binding protein [Ideonella sp.]MCC7459526.1 ABC transporter ATP-binding protein [Nitrospira sp.]
MKLLEIDDLALAFGGVQALAGVSFAVQRGEVFSIIGPNGAGKTTIFNVISRLYAPDRGRVHFDGRDLVRVAPHAVIGLGIARTFQNVELFEHATVMDNLLLGRHVRFTTGFVRELLFLPSVRREEREHRESAERVIDFLDLQRYRDAPIGALPYGARKIVELGRALVAEPALLLLDEPSSGLNAEETEEMAYWIGDIQQDLGVTVMMIEHDMSLVGEVSDRVLVLNHGRVLVEGAPQDVQRHPEVVRAYLGQ